MTDKIYTSAPINRNAARVIGKGEHYEPKLRPGHAPHQDVPFVTHSRTKKQHDLTGTKFGSLTVVGRHGKVNKKKKTMWSVKCVCGRYELRRGPTIKAAVAKGNSTDCCVECHHLRKLKGSQKYRNYGESHDKEML